MMFFFKRKPRQARLEAIFIAAGAGARMTPITRTRAFAAAGLEGDRYHFERGFWQRTDACWVTLIRSEDLRKAEKRGGFSLQEGQHRRNLVISGLPPLLELRNGELHIGQARFRVERMRPPCGYLDRVFRAGAAKALGRGAGVCLVVLREGDVQVGDPVRATKPAERH